MSSMRRLFLVITTCAALALAVPGSAHAASTIVSLTFDDGWDTQQVAATDLAARGMIGTFYVNSGTIEQTGHLTWSQLDTFNAAGNEIGGHTVDHPDLTTLDPTQAQSEICQDRVNIMVHGFVVNSFAYPFGAYDANTGAGALDVTPIVQQCGYASGRGAFGLHNITATNDTRPYATTIPPPNRYAIPTPCCINYASFGGSPPTAAALESYVQHAESGGGGWVIFFFHRLCDNCGGDTPAPSMSPTEFQSFLDWLQSNQTTVRTVGQAISGDTQPPSSSIACGGTACSSGWYGGPVSVSLSATDSQSGVASIHYTTDGSDPTVASPTYTGSFSVSATTTVKYRAWDNSGNVEPANTQLIQIDTTAPTSSISCNGASCSSGWWYNAAVNVSLSATDSQSGVASIHYTTDGSDPTLASPVYTVPFAVSSTTTVKYRAWDYAGNVEAINSQLIQLDTTAPTVAIACNSSPCQTWYNAVVTVTLTASDGQSGVAQIRYTTDGTTPTLTNGTVYTAPFAINANAKVEYSAWDNAGNASTTASQVLSFDTIAPAVAITSPANGATVASSTTVSANASDTGGSGLASVRFYLDGTTLLSTQKGPKYSFQWNTKTTAKGQHTLTAVATDNAGNATTSAPVTVTVR